MAAKKLLITKVKISPENFPGSQKALQTLLDVGGKEVESYCEKHELMPGLEAGIYSGLLQVWANALQKEADYLRNAAQSGNPIEPAPEKKPTNSRSLNLH